MTIDSADNKTLAVALAVESVFHDGPDWLQIRIQKRKVVGRS
jgi:hypothetical protein